MKNGLKRYWFEFEIPNAFDFPPGIGIGCGVTAFDFEDAIKLMDQKIFTDISRPPFKKRIENVDIQDLDQGHVIPNMGVVIYRGIWFPRGYS